MRRMHWGGPCHEAVMWRIHHVSAPEQHTSVSRVHVPPRSTTRHDDEAGSSSQEAALCDAHEMRMTCADCHNGAGIVAQGYTDLDGNFPEDPNYPSWAKQRPRGPRQFG